MHCYADHCSVDLKISLSCKMTSQGALSRQQSKLPNHSNILKSMTKNETLRGILLYQSVSVDVINGKQIIDMKSRKS